MNKRIKSDLILFEKKNKSDNAKSEKILRLIAVSKYPFLYFLLDK